MWTTRAAYRLVVRACLIVAVVLIYHSKHSASGSSPQYGAFAGYDIQTSQVTSIGASWLVPAIVTSSAAGSASTWIGVQDPRGRLTDPFIQIGITETRLSPTVDAYEAFWSDTAYGFHPLNLFAVRPNDEISAALVLQGRVWHAQISDETTHQSQAFMTSQETAVPLGQAEWLQEDPHDPTSRRLPPYADTSPVTFSSLTINGLPPAAGDLRAQAMGLPTAELDASPVADDTFTITEQPRAAQ